MYLIQLGTGEFHSIWYVWFFFVMDVYSLRLEAQLKKRDVDSCAVCYWTVQINVSRD